MNEASTWRYALAQKLAPHYSANPKVAAIVVRGSVTLGYADRYSDTDLGVFWASPPTESDPSLLKQQHIAALLSAFPLYNPALLQRWQSKASVYPHELAVAMVRAHLLFCPAWGQEALAEGNDLLALYDSFCTTEKRILLVLMGLNHIYYPGFQWIDRLIGQMYIAPPNLASRCKQVFGIVGIDPLAGVYQLHELIEDTLSLVQTHLGEFDTTQVRAEFVDRPKIWEHAPDGLS